MTDTDVLALPDGLHAEVSMAQYHALPYVGHSRVLTKMRRSPQYCHETEGVVDEDTDATIIGTAVHTLLLDGMEAFDAMFCVAKPCQAILKSGLRKDQECGADSAISVVDGGFYCGTHAKGMEEDKSRPVLTEKECLRAQYMAAAVERDEEASRVLRLAPQREVTVIWTDPETKERCKGRLDIFGIHKVASGTVVQLWDLKKSIHAQPSRFDREILSRGYHTQIAWYYAGLKVLGYTPDIVGFIVVNDCAKDDVHEVGTYELVQDALLLGLERNEQTLREYHDCRLTGKWPGFGRRYLGVPAYALATPEAENEEE